MLTAAFAKRLFNNGHGVIYASVEVTGGMNIAVSSLTFNEYFEVLWTELLEVKRHYGYGLYECNRLRATREFSADGEINWNTDRPLDRRHQFRGGYAVRGGDRRGWRVPSMA